MGIYLLLLGDNKLVIGMQIYIQETIDFFDEDVSTKLSSPEDKNMQKVDT